MIAGRILEKLALPSSALRLDRSRCLRMRFAESGCSHCTTICPSGAIATDDGISLQTERCTGCLACTAVCPSGALETNGEFPAILEALASHRLPVFVIGCRVSGPRSHKQLPCLGMLSPEHLLALFARGTVQIQLAAHACSGCPAGSMLEHLASRLHETARITGLALNRRIQLVTSEQDISFREENLDRRSFFTSLRSIAFQGVATALAPVSRDNPGTSYRDKTLPERRALFLTVLRSLPTAEASAVRDAFFFTATFSDACDGCLGCVRVCPTAAIVETDDACPSFVPERCTGCGLCREFCLEGAVDVTRGIGTTHSHPKVA